MTEPVDQYLRTFQWNKVKYRADRSIGELIDLLKKVQLITWVQWRAIVRVAANGHQEAASIDSDIRSKYSQYNQVKNTLATLQRKQTYVYTLTNLMSY